jgi:hypothetical protein
MGDRVNYWGARDYFFGAGFFLLLRAIAPVLVAGPFLAALLGALQSAVVVGGLSESMRCARFSTVIMF